MTIVAAWIRTVGKTRELVVASDSMLSGAMRWDVGPKVFPLTRGDAVIAFAGSTAFAYPLIAQILHGSDDYDRSRSRAQDLCDLKGHMQRTCRDMLSRVVADPRAFDWKKDFQLLLAGYSWQQKDFKIWVSRPEGGKFTLARATKTAGAVFIGDATAVKRAKAGLAKRVHRSGGTPVSLTWQPLDVIVELIRESSIDTVGGAPQIAKVYVHQNTLQYAVAWDGGLTLSGRRLLSYERTQRLVLDPLTKKQRQTWEYVDG